MTYYTANTVPNISTVGDWDEDDLRLEHACCVCDIDDILSGDCDQELAERLDDIRKLLDAINERLEEFDGPMPAA